MNRVCSAMKAFKLKGLQVFTEVIQVFEALSLEVMKVLNRTTKGTEHRGTNFCVSVIQVFETLTLSMFKVLNRSSKWEEHRDAKFSNLPNLVLWKIIDRLDFPDSLRIASVCNRWREASLSYTKVVKFRGESPPWIMIRSVQGSAESTFVNISTGETYSIFNEDFCQAGSATLFSKQGWFLLHIKFDRNGSCINEEGMTNFFLLNPFTNKKIELPFRSILLHTSYCGAFTIKDGKPDLVVVVADYICGGYGCIRLWTIRVGEKNLWTEHTYEPPEWTTVGRVVIIGQDIYILCGRKTFMIFSLSSCQWIQVRQSWGDSKRAYIVETDEGEFWKIHMPCTTFHRLSNRGWEQVKVKEQKHLCCFVKPASIDYLVSKFVVGDVVDAFSHYIIESQLFERKIIEYENDADRINRVVMYIINENIAAEWVDMP